MVSLELPSRYKPEDLERLLNERLRRIAGLLSTSGEAGGASVSSGASGLLLAVPGTLSVRSNAAPLVKLASSRRIAQLVALLKRAPSGAGITLRLQAGGAEVASVAIAAGATAGEASVSATIGAETLVTLDITGVGSVFPGADLSLLVRFGN